MAEFEQLRAELAAHRDELGQCRQEALLAREALRKAERALEEFRRAETPLHRQERARLEKAVEGARVQAKRVGDRLNKLSVNEKRLQEAFQVFTDPRTELSRLPDGHPILLLPLRIETRFKTNEAQQPQLWVRVFPDTCLVDAFEDSLTEQEIGNARAFWAAIWRAGGDEALERIAWRDLVASHGSGRAGWIVRRYAPLNPDDKPVKDNPTDVLLIILAPGPLPAAASTYWQTVWKASGDTAAQRKAYTALKEAVGAQQARRIVEESQPFNVSETPGPGRSRRAQVKAAVMQLASPEDLQTRRASWSSAPRVDLLPERFVLVAYSQTGAPLVEISRPVRVPLIAGPDPNAPPEQQLKPVDDTLQIPDELAWMFDFERALEAGMAFRVDLTPAQATAGFERVIVLGVRLADTPQTGQQGIERLIEHHLHSRPGLEILPQGTPTNNTEKGGSGYSFRENADATFEAFFRQKPQYSLDDDQLLRRDGQWLAELLGLRHDLIQRIPNAGGRDQSEARAMQIALWPGTMGYMMNTLLAPVFSPQDIANTRGFFTRNVSGRGPLPALRIGAQPYGILPITAFNQVNWFKPNDQAEFAGRLHAILRRITDDWKLLVQRISFIGKQGSDPHQILLDVLGLHPTSVEYYPLQAEDVKHKFYELALLDYAAAISLLNLSPPVNPMTLLRDLGYAGVEAPDLLSKLFRTRQTPLNGPLIDDRPLSETERIRAYAGGRNYIEWLTDAAQTGIEAVQQEQGFDNNKKPVALLYLLLRHALQLSFHATAVRLQAEAAGAAASLPREPVFIHVADVQKGSESRYEALFRTDRRITGRDDLLVGDHIARNILSIDAELREQIKALKRLSQVPTARLERLFAEHIDTCSYRLDAWKTGLLTWQLKRMRRGPEGEEIGGLFLGAYGWLEPLRPENKVLTPVVLPRDLADDVNRRDGTPLMRDSTNEGLIHAPSINHATTAAVLRNGYLANDGRLAVNLSSRRVRLALEILEGMRNGQSLGALLGYQFERHVHDHGPLQVRDLIYPLRRAFPLAARQIASTDNESGEPREVTAAMNVVDGRKLIEHVERAQNFTYPFGLAELPRRPAPPDQEAAITNALVHIRDLNDAVSDLILAEGVHQAVLGNYDRSAGTLDAFAKGGYPPEPEVIRTPRSGIALTLRTAIHLAPSPPSPGTPTPLAAAEPAVNAWLKDRLPAPAIVGCHVSFIDRQTGDEQTLFISQQDLGLYPIDLIYRAEAGTEQSSGDLEDRILQYLYTHHAPRHDRPITIRYTEREAGKVNWFELQALLGSLRALVKTSRPLQPADLMRTNDAARDDQAAVSLAKSRIETPRDDLRDNLIPALDTLATALANPAVDIDAAIDQFASTVGRLAEYRLPQTGTGFVYEWRAGAYAALTRKIDERVKTWDGRLARYLERIEEYDNLPPATPEPDRIALLQAAEILISTRLTPVGPGGSAAYRATLDDRRQEFEDKRDALRDLVDGARATLAQFLVDAEAQLVSGALPPVSDFDPEPLGFSEDRDEIARFRTGLADAVTRLKDDVNKRIDQINAKLGEHDPATAIDRVKLLQEAAKILFGDDFQMIPPMTIPAAAAEELANAWQHGVSGELTRHVTDTVGRDFPVDDWLHGVARVREKMHHWENAILLGEAFGVAQLPALIPLQLPHGPNEPWLALEIPDGYRINSDRLLYAANFARPFDKTEPVCGLLVDEWTEVIPGTEETTGIAFHYDRPNAEPPQTWLLALPAVRDGAWSWNELLAAVNDTLDAAKLRCIEPAHLDNTAYSWFLPATVCAYTYPEISVSNNWLKNVQINTKLSPE